MSCCLSKLGADYTQGAAANSLKTAVPVCVMPFSYLVNLVQSVQHAETVLRM